MKKKILIIIFFFVTLLIISLHAVQKKDSLEEQDPLEDSQDKLNIDYDYHSVLENTSLFFRNKKKLEMNRLIQKTLLKGAGSVVVTDDPFLFKGALPTYKKAFLEYQAVYSPYIEQYLKLLSDQLGYSGKHIKLLSYQLKLEQSTNDKDETDEKQLRVSEVQIPDISRKVYSPVAQLNPGFLELRDTFRIGKEIESIQYGSCTYGDVIYVQTSRHIISLKNGKVVWDLCYDHSNPTVYSSKDKLLKFKRSTKYKKPDAFKSINRLMPVSDGEILITRIIDKKKLKVIAVRCDNGKEIWSSTEKGHTLSDPLIWQDKVIFIGAKKDVIIQYYLFILNKMTGTVEEKLPLFSSFAKTFYPISRPSISGDYAFFNNNNGMLFCINLKNHSIEWVRRYIESLLRKRKRDFNIVVGKKNIFFSPQNSFSLFLIEKETGKLVEKLEEEYVEIFPFGENLAFMVLPSKEFIIISLDDLKEVKRVKAESFNFLHHLSNGAILNINNSIEILSENTWASSSLPVPSNIKPIGVAGKLLYCYNSDDIVPNIGVLDLKQKQTDKIYINIENNMHTLYNPTWRIIDGQLYSIAENYIVSFDDKAKIKWAYPLLEKPAVKYYKDELFLTFPDYIMSLDSKTGKPVWQYKSEGIIYSADFIKGSLYINEYHKTGNRDNIIKKVSGSKVITCGKMKSSYPVVGIYDEKTVIANYKNNIFYFTKDTKGQYEYSAEVFSGSMKKKVYKSKSKTRVKYTVNSKERIRVMKMERVSQNLYIAFANIKNKYACLVMYKEPGNRLFRKLEIIYNKSKLRLSSRVMESMNLSEQLEYLPKQGLLLFKFFDQQEYYNVVKVPELIDLTSKLRLHNKPIIKNNNLYGISQNAANAELIVYNMKQNKTITRKPVSIPIAENSYSISVGNEAYHFFRYPNTSYKKMNVMRHDLKKNKLSKTRFPVFNGPAPFSYNNNIIIMDNNEVIVFTRDEFYNLLKSNKKSFSILKDKSFKYDLDGFPDEWNINNFHKMGTNEFNAIMLDKHMFFSCFIRDKEIIKMISSKGLKNNLKIVVLPGHLASFSLKNISGKYIFSFFNDQKIKMWDYNYSVFPTGEWCFLEIKIPVSAMFPLNKEPEKDTNLFNNLVFNIIYTDDQGETSLLFPSSVNYPAYYPQIVWK